MVSLQRKMAVCLWFTLTATGWAMAPDWAGTNSLEKIDGGYKVTDRAPWLMSSTLDERIPAERQILLIHMKNSAPLTLNVYWADRDENLDGMRSVRVHAPANDQYQTLVANLDANATYTGLVLYRIDPMTPPGITFDIRDIEFVTPDAVPAEQLPTLIEFRACTSKRHYLPGERIEYQATLNAACYPDQDSAKLLEVNVYEETGVDVLRDIQQYGLRNGSRYKEMRGCFDMPESPLPPGKYTLKARSTDLRSGLSLIWRHEFHILDKDDPYVYETPFKFVKDFSVIYGPDDRWHVFSITGDLHSDHGWSFQGQERTFSHGSSADLRHWTIHPPVLTITDQKYPDGNGYYENRNIWAPHVIEHDGRYWMFYTSINKSVSQSVSLATSTNLFEWTEYEHNPVFNLEGVEWANWGRDHWSDCRDPALLIDGDKFYLYVTANAKGPGESGAIAVAESDDLIHWKNPSIAVRGPIVSESPQVWKDGDTYCMFTSAHGAATYVSDHPMKGWKPADLKRPSQHAVPGAYAEEVVRLADDSFMMAVLTFQHWGNSIYFFRMNTQDGRPEQYVSPFTLP